MVEFIDRKKDDFDVYIVILIQEAFWFTAIAQMK
jgi:hypothetical protein